MAPNKFSTMLNRRTNKVTRVLIYAFLEWTLIFLLLLNSLFSYFILKFALYFGLKPPCFLCSRLDHLLDSHRKEKHKNSSFSSYTDIICEQHAAEISKVGYCSHHRKLVESQNMCENCSSSSSSSSSQDPELFKWMTELGIVKADDAEDDVANKCSCCDEVIKPIAKVSSLDFVIKERELLGGCFSDQNVQVGSDQSDDRPNFEYQILGDDTEEEDENTEAKDMMIFETEKEPLLSNNDDNNGKNEEIVGVISQNLCPDMLPQHLEFYIDHDDYKLIPVDLVGNSIKIENKGQETSRNIIGEEENKETSFDLVFEGDELALPGCEVRTAKNLPSIQEEEEEGIFENLQIPKHKENLEGSENFELDFEDDDDLLTEGCETENFQILKDEEKMGGSEDFELHFEGDSLVAAVCESQKLQTLKDEEQMDSSEDFELHFEGNSLLAASCESQKLHTLKDEEQMDSSEDFELHFEGNSLLAASCESQKLQTLKAEEKMDRSENIELVFEGNELVTVCEIVTKTLPTEEVSMIDKLQNREHEEEEKDSEISNPLQEEGKECELKESILLEEQEETATPENTTILDEQERNHEAIEGGSTSDFEEDNASHMKSAETETKEQNQNLTVKPVIDEFDEDIALHLRNIETETERNQNPTAELLIEVDEPSTPSRKESYEITDSGISEVSTSCPHDAEIGEGGQNAQVGKSHNEVEEEKVPDTPHSSESLHKKLMLLGRRESATEESLDGMSTTSIEQGNAGETIEKLKEDLLAERKTLRAVYKELDEERNASAIAANQTMAMITRIQEEKATMQMEALQYQRMMEEQSEYDQEALQMMNELVVKREKEKQELEKELEVYRKKVMDYEEREKLRILSRRRSRNSSASCSYGEESDGVSVDLNQEVKDQEEDAGTPHNQEENGHQDTPADAVLCLQDSLIGFEDERQAILEQLKALEEKLFTLAEEEEEEEEEHFQKMKPIEQFYEENGKESDDNDNGHGNGNGGDYNGFIHVNGQHQQERRMNGSMPKKLLLPLFDAAESLDSTDGEFSNGREDGFHITKFELEKKKFALEEEVDHVYERLHALEADREFLKHCIGSLRKGDKGLDLLQEILQHLRDLKSVELQAVKNMDHCASV